MANNTKVVTTPVRISYAHIFEPVAIVEGAKAKYSVSILIPKTNTELVKKINDAIDAAIEKGTSTTFNGKKPNKAALKLPIKDGDDKEDSVYHGHWYLNVSSNNAPQVVDRDLNPIFDKSEVVSGDYCRVSINFGAYNVTGSKGVSAYLGNIQFVRKGEPLGGRTSASTDFGNSSDDDFL